MWRRTLAILAGALSALAAFAARAEPGTSLQGALSVRPGADACIAEPALRARVERWTKPGALQPGVTVVVNAASQPLSFSLERGGNVVAKRDFEVLPAACDDRLDAVALAIALAIEHASAISELRTGVPAATTASATTPTKPPDATKPPPADKPQQQAKKPTQETPVPTAVHPKTAQPATNAAQRTVRRVRLQAGGTLLLDVLPDPALAVSAGAEWLLAEHVHLALAGLFAPQTRVAFGGGSALTELFAGRALACLSWPVARFGLETCAGAASGAARAKGEGFSQGSQTATMAWVAGVLRAAVRYPADGSISVRVAADGLGNILRPKFEVNGFGAPFATAFPLGVAGSLEVLFALP